MKNYIRLAGWGFAIIVFLMLFCVDFVDGGRGRGGGGRGGGGGRR